MKDEIISAIDGIEDDIIEEYFKMKKSFLKEKKIKRSLKWYHIIPLAACFVFTFIGIFEFFIFNKQSNVGDDYNTNFGDVVTDAVVYKYNGFLVSYELYEEITNASDDDYIDIVVNPNGGMSKDFIYKGKTYEQYNQEYMQNKDFLKKQEELLSDGELLKYGEVLYTSGTPTGVKWSEKRYNKTIEYYGEELLKLYVTEGTFFKEKLENDILNTMNKMDDLKKAMEETRAAYVIYFAEQNISLFTNVGVEACIKDEKINLHLTKRQLAELLLENKEIYSLDLSK